MTDIPRRNRVDRWTPAEQAISDAKQSVERMPADPRLTAAVVMLGEAQDQVADFIDSVPFRPRVIMPEPDYIALLSEKAQLEAALPPLVKVTPDFWDEAAKTEPMLQLFAFFHLNEKLAAVSRPFGELALKIATELPRNPERTVALRKLREAKDAAVTALLWE